MAVYAKGEKFMASFGAGATRVRKTFVTEADALLWETQLEAAREAVNALPAPVATCWDLKQALEQTVRHEWKGKGGERVARLNAASAMSFFGPDTLTSEITSAWIVEWMEELEDKHGNSGSTRNRKLSALMMMLKRAEGFGGLTTLPRTKRSNESEHRVRWFTDAEEESMIKMSNHLGLTELADFIIIGLDTGFRRSELLGLTLGDYHKGMLMLHAGETKTGAARSVPCRHRVKEILAKRIADGHSRVFPTLTNSALRKQWEDLRSLLGKADDVGFIPHVLRHTCATRLVSEGVPLTTVQAWMGHKVIQTTMRYAHVVGGQMNAAMEALEARSRHND